MGTIAEKLNKLQTTKQAIKEAIINKGVSVNDADTFASYADKINSITVGGSEGDIFEPLGYSTPKYIQDGIDYAQTIKDNWDATKTDRRSNFSGDNKLVFFPSVDTSNVTDMYRMFYKCSKLQFVPHLDTSKTRNFNQMFWNCSNLTSIDLSNWNTSNVTNMSDMFYGCCNLTSLDLSNWNTSNVTNMSNVFNRCSGLTSLDLSNWNTSNVQNMGSMFNYCSNLTSLDLSPFDTSNVTNMSDMFYMCENLTSLDISTWNTSNVTNMNNMFASIKRLTSLDLSSFDTSKVNNFSYMIGNCVGLEKVDGYISFKSFSASTMNYSYIMGYSKQTNLRKITFKDIGYHTNAKQFNMSYASVWGIDSDTITDARQSLIDSLVTYSFDRATASYATCTVTLSTDTKAVLTDDEIAAITAKGFTIA